MRKIMLSRGPARLLPVALIASVAVCAVLSAQNTDDVNAWRRKPQMAQAKAADIVPAGVRASRDSFFDSVLGRSPGGGAVWEARDRQWRFLHSQLSWWAGLHAL